MTSPEYHITKLQANLHPQPGERVRSLVNIELEMGQGEFDSERRVLTADSTIDISFHDPAAIDDLEEGEEAGEPGFGEMSVDMIIFSDLEEAELSEELSIQEEIEAWNSKGYEHLSPELLSHIETDIIAEIFAPIDGLIRQSITGLLPRYRFTMTPEEEEEYERLREEVEDGMKE